MKIEYELRVLEINVEEIKKKLEKLGAKKIASRNMRRFVYELPVDGEKVKHKWIRLRDQGDKITLTIKEITSNAIDGTKELEITVDDFDKTNALLKLAGFKATAYQENKRESYSLDGVDVEIDTWPRIPSYLEVEGPSEEKVLETLKKLGFSKEETTAINNIDIYKKYGFEIQNIKRLTFE